ncbi:MAG: cytochrome c3 family protein [Rhodocyclaceae bacterium]|nr:cytochrome c3 family protein [Rhodocyclaceae bacterium]
MAPPPRSGRITGVGALLGALLLCAFPVHADMRLTPHSLVKREAGKAPVDEREICVFCHTPQAGRGQAGVPRWQASLASDFVFTLYDDIGRLGLDRPSVGSQSIACLSCHDANQALEVGKTSADHPFGVPYRGALKRSPNAPAGRAVENPDEPRHVHARRLLGLEDFRDVSQGTIENRRFWWVSADGIGTRRTRRDLPLYGRRDAATGEETPHIECSSCHDPHSPNGQFLRVANNASALCLTCHTK